MLTREKLFTLKPTKREPVYFGFRTIDEWAKASRSELLPGEIALELLRHGYLHLTTKRYHSFMLGGFFGLSPRHKREALKVRAREIVNITTERGKRV